MTSFERGAGLKNSLETVMVVWPGRTLHEKERGVGVAAGARCQEREKAAARRLLAGALCLRSIQAKTHTTQDCISSEEGR